MRLVLLHTKVFKIQLKAEIYLEIQIFRTYNFRSNLSDIDLFSGTGRDTSPFKLFGSETNPSLKSSTIVKTPNSWPQSQGIQYSI